MALSPVVTHTVESVQQTQQLARAISSPLKNFTSGHTSSSNGTPKPLAAPLVPAPTTIPVTLDLAEQMNDEEKRKYVKGEEAAPKLDISNRPAN